MMINLTRKKQTKMKKTVTAQQVAERYAELYENISDVIWIYNFTQGKYTYMSPSVFQLCGLTESEAMAKDFCESFSPGSAQKVIRDLPIRVSEFLNGIRTTYIDQIQQICKDGSLKWIETATKYRLSKDKTIEIYGVSRDISVRKQVEAELQHKNEQLRKINAEKDKFFSIIAHDLRGPSVGFLGLTELMAEGLSHMTLDEIQKTALLMRNSAANLFRLLGNLLEWSRMQRGMTSFVPATFLLMPKISEIMVLVQEAANKKELRINYDIPNDLMVFADENMLGVIIRNLGSNAVKFTPIGGGITISARSQADNSVGISIKDSGIGMNKHMVDHLFNLNVNTNRNGTDGEYSTGLGLIICKDFIEKHGGELWVESEEGVGSTFRFSLPANPHRVTTAAFLKN